MFDDDAREFLEAVLNGDPNDPHDARVVAEHCWAHYTDPAHRRYLRERAAMHRRQLEECGHDLSSDAVCHGLWVAWLHSSSTWQQYIMGDCLETEHMEYHATRALQWSGIVLLLTTEPTTPDPIDTEVSE